MKQLNFLSIGEGIPQCNISYKRAYYNPKLSIPNSIYCLMKYVETLNAIFVHKFEQRLALWPCCARPASKGIIINATVFLTTAKRFYHKNWMKDRTKHNMLAKIKAYIFWCHQVSEDGIAAADESEAVSQEPIPPPDKKAKEEITDFIESNIVSGTVQDNDDDDGIDFPDTVVDDFDDDDDEEEEDDDDDDDDDLLGDFSQLHDFSRGQFQVFFKKPHILTTC